MGNTFDGTHTHYLATASTTLDSDHIEALLTQVTEHGYKRDGATMLILLNETDFEASRISAWRAGEQCRSSGPLPKWDFIPSARMPVYSLGTAQDVQHVPEVKPGHFVV
jgi:hypothetical protein